jgi:hypothetical protein
MLLAEDVLMLKPPGPLADRNRAMASGKMATYSSEQLCDWVGADDGTGMCNQQMNETTGMSEGMRIDSIRRIVLLFVCPLMEYYSACLMHTLLTTACLFHGTST